MASADSRQHGGNHNFLGNLEVDGTLVVDGAMTFNGAITAAGGITVPTGDTLVVTDAAGLTVGGLKPVQYVYVSHMFSLPADMVDGSIFIADVAMTLVAISEIHKTAEAAGTVAIVPMRQQGTEAPSAGDVLVTGGFNGVGTAETLQTGTVVTAGNVHKFAAGNRLGIDFTGDVPGELAGAVITAKFSID